MVEFDELRHLWQSQDTPDTPRALDGRAMTEVLRRFHRRQTAINCFRCALLLFALIWAPLHAENSVKLAGVMLILIGAAIYMFIDWRNQVGVANLDFTRPSVEFVENGIERLRDVRNPFRRTFWLFIGTAMVGFNLMYLVPSHPLSWEWRAINHVTATGLPFAAYGLGLWVRRKRIEKDVQPIEEKLVSMQQSLREQVR
jgi:hypothetical protein